MMGKIFRYVLEDRPTKEIESLLDRGADPNTRGGSYNYTLLHNAASAGSVDTVRLLLERGAEVHVYNVDMQTPFHLATLSLLTPSIKDDNQKRDAYLQVLKLLLEAEAKVRLQRHDWQSLLLQDHADKNQLVPMKMIQEDADKEIGNQFLCLLAAVKAAYPDAFSEAPPVQPIETKTTTTSSWRNAVPGLKHRKVAVTSPADLAEPESRASSSKPKDSPSLLTQFLGLLSCRPTEPKTATPDEKTHLLTTDTNHKSHSL